MIIKLVLRRWVLGISYWNAESEYSASSDCIDSLSHTPAFIFDEGYLSKNLAKLEQIRSAGNCKVLYSIKACPLEGLLKYLQGHLDGFSVSSLFEARLAHEVTKGQSELHITTPGLRREELTEIGELCEAVSFNSLSQLERLPFLLGGKAKVGLRVNPQLSFLDDPRYDPCRTYSKLGAPLPQVIDSWGRGRLSARGLNGLHLHTNFASNTLAPLQATVQHLEAQLPELVQQIDWINLGGGYQFQAAQDLDLLFETIQHIERVWGAEVYLEPGSSIVDDAGLLVTSVIDTFQSDGKSIAVLDSSVNHLPEVFEYQIKPHLRSEAQSGSYAITLVGSTCLSGDLFGEYRFDRPLEIDDRVIFDNVGAYSLVKASRFNGLNLPSIYFRDVSGGHTLMRSYDYEEYRQQWAVSNSLQLKSTTTG
jgi:carboxynorspermidine decarboxylase